VTDDRNLQSIASRALESNPFMSLRDLSRKIRDIADVTISAASVHLLVKKIGFTHKKARWFVDSPAIQASRAAFHGHLEREGIGVDDVLNFDESNFVHINRPINGWAQKGKRLNARCRVMRGKSTSLLMAISRSGIKRWKVSDQTTTAESVAKFITDHLMDTGKTHLMMDNASIHKTEGVRSACRQVGLKPLFLPPYTPAFAPVETCFSVIKSRLRRSTTSGDRAQFMEILRAEIDAVACTSQLFDKCWSRMDVAART
jgi:transposase